MSKQKILFLLKCLFLMFCFFYQFVYKRKNYGIFLCNFDWRKKFQAIEFFRCFFFFRNCCLILLNQRNLMLKCIDYCLCTLQRCFDLVYFLLNLINFWMIFWKFHLILKNYSFLFLEFYQRCCYDFSWMSNLF